MLGHKPPEASGMRSVQTEEFIEQEYGGLRKIHLLCRVEATQFRVGLYGCASGRQAKHELRHARQSFHDAMGERSTCVRCGFEDPDVQRRLEIRGKDERSARR